MKTSLIRTVLRISLWYALFGVLWILLSDTLLLMLVEDVNELMRLQLYKGWFFVVLSALFIFLLLNHHLSIREDAERDLQENEERYRLLFENSLDAILLTSPDGTIFSANPAACRMFEKTEEEIRRVGRSGLVDAADPRLKTALEERARTGRFAGELTFIRKSGGKFPGEISTSLFI
ncbi:MAG: PAS domain S-box protein, partial [Candidatus Dadabacteria bacterium]